jgi:transposase
MGNHRTNNPKEERKIPISGAKTPVGQSRSKRHSICAQNRDRLGRFAAGAGVWFRNDLLAKTSRLATSRCMGQNPQDFIEQSQRSRQYRLFTFSCGFYLGKGRFWGAKTGPNPTDCRKKGSKHHLVTDANGIPLSVKLTGANRHDVTQLMPLIDSIPPIAGKVGRLLQRPDIALGDRAYDSEPHRKQLRKRGIFPLLVERGSENGSGLGVYRWVVERSQSWLHQNRRLRIRYEKRDDIHEAFLVIGCVKICWNHLANSSFC